MNSLQLRLPPPIYLLLTGAIMWVISNSFIQGTLYLGVFSHMKWAFLLIGLAIDLSSLLHFFASKTTPSPFNPNKTSRLITTGWYRYSRNPMYLGMCLLLIAWAIHLANLYALFCVALFIWVLNQAQIKPEELALKQKFGAQYAAYCAQVRRWI